MSHVAFVALGWSSTPPPPPLCTGLYFTTVCVMCMHCTALCICVKHTQIQMILAAYILPFFTRVVLIFLCPILCNVIHCMAGKVMQHNENWIQSTIQCNAKRNDRASQGSKIFGRVFQGGLSLQVTVEWNVVPLVVIFNSLKEKSD